MGEINKFQLKVDLFQSLKKGDSENYRDFSQRVNAAVEVLKTTFKCDCSTLELHDFVKILFVAGLKPQEAAQCYESAGDDLENLISLLEGQPISDLDNTSGTKKQLYQLINCKETAQTSNISSSHNNPEEQHDKKKADPRKRRHEDSAQVLVFPVVKVEQAMEELDSLAKNESEQMEVTDERVKAQQGKAKNALEEMEQINQPEKRIKKEIETASEDMEDIDEQEKDLIAAEEQQDDNVYPSSKTQEPQSLSFQEISKKISQYNESLKGSVWRAMQKAAAQGDAVKIHTTPDGKTVFSCNFCPAKFATKQLLESHGRYCSKSKQNTIQVWTPTQYIRLKLSNFGLSEG